MKIVNCKGRIGLTKGNGCFSDWQNGEERVNHGIISTGYLEKVRTIQGQIRHHYLTYGKNCLVILIVR